MPSGEGPSDPQRNPRSGERPVGTVALEDRLRPPPLVSGNDQTDADHRADGSKASGNQLPHTYQRRARTRRPFVLIRVQRAPARHVLIARRRRHGKERHEDSRHRRGQDHRDAEDRQDRHTRARHPVTSAPQPTRQGPSRPPLGPGTRSSQSGLQREGLAANPNRAPSLMGLPSGAYPDGLSSAGPEGDRRGTLPMAYRAQDPKAYLGAAARWRSRPGSFLRHLPTVLPCSPISSRRPRILEG
jgi:hypothetical protein